MAAQPLGLFDRAGRETDDGPLGKSLCSIDFHEYAERFDAEYGGRLDGGEHRFLGRWYDALSHASPKRCRAQETTSPMPRRAMQRLGRNPLWDKVVRSVGYPCAPRQRSLMTERESVTTLERAISEHEQLLVEFGDIAAETHASIRRGIQLWPPPRSAYTRVCARC